MKGLYSRSLEETTIFWSLCLGRQILCSAFNVMLGQYSKTFSIALILPQISQDSFQAIKLCKNDLKHWIFQACRFFMRYNILHLSIFPVSSLFSCPIRGESRIWTPNTSSVQFLCQALLPLFPSPQSPSSPPESSPVPFPSFLSPALPKRAWYSG